MPDPMPPPPAVPWAQWLLADGLAWRFPAHCDAGLWSLQAQAWLVRPADTATALSLAWALRQVDSDTAARLAQACLDRTAAGSASAAPAAAPPQAAAVDPGPDSIAELCQAYAQLVLAETAWLMGEPEAARQRLGQARGPLQRAGAQRGLSDLHWLGSQLAADAGRTAERDQALAEAISHAQAAGDARRVACGQLALACVAAMDQASEQTPAAAVLVHRHAQAADPGLRMLAQLALQHSSSHARDARSAIAHGEQARAAALACGQWRRAVLVSCNIGLELFDLQVLDEALASLEEALPLARSCGWPVPLATLLQAMAQCLLALDRPSAALDLAREAVALSQRQPHSRGALLALIALGDALLALPQQPGAQAEAEAVYRQLQAAAQAAGDEAVLCSADYGLARVLQAQGQLAPAWAHAAASLQRAQGHDEAQAVLCLRLQATLAGAAAPGLLPGRPSPLPLLQQAVLRARQAHQPAGQHALHAELAAQYTGHGAHAAASEAWQTAYEALKAQRSQELVQRAAALEVRLRTESALAQARLDRERAQAEQQRAAELDALNTQLQATLAELRQTQALLLQKNELLGRANSSLNALSLTDPLTQLHNRRFFDSVIEHCAEEAWASWQPPATAPRDLLLFMLDLDHFKAINDSHGHAAGDAVLSQLGERLRTVARAQDYVVRWGGEEFLLLLRSATRQDAPAIAQRLLDTVAARPFELGPGRHVASSCSVGYCAYPLDPGPGPMQDWRLALARADARLYEAKRQGRNRALG
jgi:diguanylate cyclase (GGDEF)-like protein